MKPEKNVVRHRLKDGLCIDPRLLRNDEDAIEYFPFKPTKEECSPRPSVQGFGENGCLEVVCKVKPLVDGFLVHVSLKGDVDILDDHDLTMKRLKIDEEADLSLSDDPQMADILPDQDGRYDLKPTLLALFYDAVPAVYSTVPLTRIEGDGFSVYSEDEFKEELERERKKVEKGNPFSKLLK